MVMEPDPKSLLWVGVAIESGIIDRETAFEVLDRNPANSYESWSQLLKSRGKMTRDGEQSVTRRVEQLLSACQGDTLKALSRFVIDGAAREAATVSRPTGSTRDEPSDYTHIHLEEPEERFFPIARLGEGGMGEVWLSRDLQIDRLVALKTIRRDRPITRRNLEMFEKEGITTAQLQHPGITPVFARGRNAAGRPWYAMKLIGEQRVSATAEQPSTDGEAMDWSDAVKSFHAAGFSCHQRSTGVWSLHELLRRFCSACEALQYAHSRKIPHFDVSPRNIRLGEHGETYVIDWGLSHSRPAQFGARNIDVSDCSSDPDETDASALASADLDTLDGAESDGRGLSGRFSDQQERVRSPWGNPGFWAPEQFRGEEGTFATDVFLLGGVLYYLLVGRAPYDPKEKDHNAGLASFPLPRSVNSLVPPALEAICLRAMQLKPQDRFSSPQELCDQVKAYLDDEPVACYREPLWERTLRWTRRFPARTAAVVTTVAAVLCISLLVNYYWQQNYQTADRLVAVAGEITRTMADRSRPNDPLEIANSALDAADKLYLTSVELGSPISGVQQEDLDLRRGAILELLDARDGRGSKAMGTRAEQFYLQRYQDQAFESTQARFNLCMALGRSTLHLKKYADAERYFAEAETLAAQLSPPQEAELGVLRARFNKTVARCELLQSGVQTTSASSSPSPTTPPPADTASSTPSGDLTSSTNSAALDAAYESLTVDLEKIADEASRKQVAPPDDLAWLELTANARVRLAKYQQESLQRARGTDRESQLRENFGNAIKTAAQDYELLYQRLSGSDWTHLHDYNYSLANSLLEFYYTDRKEIHEGLDRRDISSIYLRQAALTVGLPDYKRSWAFINNKSNEATFALVSDVILAQKSAKEFTASHERLKSEWDSCATDFPLTDLPLPWQELLGRLKTYSTAESALLTTTLTACQEALLREVHERAANVVHIYPANLESLSLDELKEVVTATIYRAQAHLLSGLTAGRAAVLTNNLAELQQLRAHVAQRLAALSGGQDELTRGQRLSLEQAQSSLDGQIRRTEKSLAPQTPAG